MNPDSDLCVTSCLGRVAKPNHPTVLSLYFFQTVAFPIGPVKDPHRQVLIGKVRLLNRLAQLCFRKLSKASVELARANLAANGIAALNPLQLSALDAGMRGLDMIVHAETGSGKTLCFGLPLLSRIEPSGPPLQALILAPTLELAAQITRVLNALQPGAAG